MARKKRPTRVRPKSPARVRKTKRKRRERGRQHHELLGLGLLCAGLFLAFVTWLEGNGGIVLDIVEVERYADAAARLDVPCPAPYKPHALATVANRNICVVLSPSHEIKVFAEGVQTFSFRNARWHLLDIAAKYQMWADTLGSQFVAHPPIQPYRVDVSDPSPFSPR